MKLNNTICVLLVIAVKLCIACNNNEKIEQVPSPKSVQDPVNKNENSANNNQADKNINTHTNSVSELPLNPVQVSNNPIPPPSQVVEQSVKKKVIAWNGDQSKFAGVKKSIQSLPKVPSISTVSTANQFIEAGGSGTWTDWMSNADLNLQQTEKVVLVNASNTSISFNGSGINGAINNFVTNVHKQTSWQDLELPDGTKNPTSIKPGEYAISTAGNWKIYHACGVCASDIGLGKIESVEKAQQIMTKMTYNMLERAELNGIKAIVLCAISTLAFASAGVNADESTFTQDQFLRAMYIGMYMGIDKFKQTYPGFKLSIMLNSWNLNALN